MEISKDILKFQDWFGPWNSVLSEEKASYTTQIKMQQFVLLHQVQWQKCSTEALTE